MTFQEAAEAAHADLVTLRRAIHATPEVGLHLPRTQEKVLAALAGLPLEVSTGSALTSVTAVLRGGRPGPTVLLRGDMDALEVPERSGLDFASRVPGVSHACGHDLHTAMLVGAAHLLSDRRESLAGTVVFMFQPGEEGCDGAGLMVKEGVLDVSGERPIAAYALHVNSALVPRGTVATRSGPLLAASDAVSVSLRGTGGHGATPYLANDPLPAACEIVTTLQTRVARRFNPFDPAIVTVGSLQGGTRRNVIPETVDMAATVRTFSPKTRARIETEIRAVVGGIAAAHGLQATIGYEPEYPVTRNDGAETEFATAVVGEVLGEDRYHMLPEPLTASEDFSRVLDEVPGSYLLLGACPPDIDLADAGYNHSPYALFDDDVIADGAALYAELAARRLDAATVPAT